MKDAVRLRAGSALDTSALKGNLKAAMQDMEPVPDDMPTSPYGFTPSDVDRIKATNESQTEIDGNGIEARLLGRITVVK